MTKKAIAALAVLLVLGCKMPWMRNVQGSSLSVGITLPTEELVQV